ncbi:hypothetical protein PR048_020075 [Dryococelus australis]|uniref:Uncharacterized protein n=1 Tax=Dryococelus australis TaxID=614101 RepID=A0ABQ9H597_9NEOP|nr:hypothetical protein PR048_020075 [Dryococelus australis]
MPSQDGSMGKDETMLGYDEIWEANAQLPSQLPSSGTQISLENKLETAKDTVMHSEVVLNMMSTDNSKLTANASHLEEDKLLYPSPRFGQKMEDEVEGCAKLLETERKHGSKSLDALGDTVDHFSKDMDVQVQQGKRKHARQQSMSILSWSHSEEFHQKPSETIPPPLPPQFERPTIDSKRISAQLECYDEALRELAQVKLVKKHGPSSLPPTRGGSELALGPNNDFTGRELAQAAIVRKQGSLSLPRNVDPPSLERASSLGTQGPSNFYFSGNFPCKELSHSAIIKKQGSLSLPRTSEVTDMIKVQSLDVGKEGYLSLPRSNELIDQAFKEMGKSSVKMKRGSRSLPRNITPEDMNMHADVASLQRNRKLFRTRRRAESESEATDKKSKRSSLKCLSFDFKLKSSKSEDSKSIAPKSQAKVDSGDSKLSPKPVSPKPAESFAATSNVNTEKPSIRKKRKILLAMRGLIAPNLKSFSDIVTPNESSVENSSIDEHPFWLSTDKAGGLERQCTVIERTVFQPVACSILKETERKLESPAHLQESIEEEDNPLSPSSEENRIIHEALKCLPSAVTFVVEPVKSWSLGNELIYQGKDLVSPEDGSMTGDKSVSNGNVSVHVISTASQNSGVVQESVVMPLGGLTDLSVNKEDVLLPEEKTVVAPPNSSLQAEVLLT